MTLIARGVKPRDRCHSADYHTSLSTGNVVRDRKMQTSSAENASNDARIRYLTMNAIYSI